MTESKKDNTTSAKALRLFKPVKGFTEINVLHDSVWEHCFNTFIQVGRGYGCYRLELPAVEPTQLFHKAWGKDNALSEQIIHIKDDNGESMVLRPQMREGALRAFLERLPDENSLWKVLYWGPIYRSASDNRTIRQLWQYGIEVLGDSDPIVDAQNVIIAWRIMESLKIPAVLNINSLGCADCRNNYFKALTDYFKGRRLELGDSYHISQKTPLKVLASEDPGLAEVCDAAPQMVDYLCSACNTNLVRVLEYLDEVEVPYQLNHKVVSDFDYFSRTIFKLVATVNTNGEERSIILAQGGRYDDLTARLGGPVVSAVGFSGLVDDLVEVVRSREVSNFSKQTPHVMLAQLGVEARKHAIVLFERLREANIIVAASLSQGGLKGQLEEAQRLGVRYAAIIGQREILDGTVLLRDMENGIQEVIDRQRLAVELAKRLMREGVLPKIEEH